MKGGKEVERNIRENERNHEKSGEKEKIERK